MVVVGLPRLQTVWRCSCSSAPCRYSSMVLCEDGLQVRMKLPPPSRARSPPSWMAAAIGWQANRSSPRTTDRIAVFGQPALGGVAFAILLLRPVLRRNEFRRQWQDLLVAGCDNASTEEGVEVFRAAIRAPPCRALRTFDLARAVMLGPVQRHWRPPAEALERRQRAGRLDRLEEQPVERRWRRTVQHQADVVVGGDRRHAKQRLAVRPAMALL